MTGRLSLIGHSADVAAVMRALLDVPVVARRLAVLLGQADLSRDDRERLVALVALHDVGKVNLGFQRASFDSKASRQGHIKPLLDALALSSGNSVRAGLRAAGLERLRHLTDRDVILKDRTDAGQAPFETVLAHHGALPGSTPNCVDPLQWRPCEGYDPMRAVGDLVEAIAAWLPAALDPVPIAWSYAFGHAFAGLVTLADWLGSDVVTFPFPDADEIPDGVARFAWACERADSLARRLWLDPAPARAAAGALAWRGETLTGFATPSAAQAAMLGLAPPSAGRICLIEDETGSGKTEAALIHFLDLFRRGEVDGMYFALPTRAAARQIHRRIERQLQRLLGPHAHVTLAVPGYLGGAAAADALADPGALHPDEAADGRRDAQWSSERPKRYLASWVAVGTIDQVLLGGLRVRHAQLRSGAMLRLLLVVDEVHSSDVYMTAILRNLLDQHLRAGGHALLMSATLGSSARARFHKLTGRIDPPPLEAAIAAPYPAVWTDAAAPLPSRSSGRAPKTVRVQLDSDWTDPERIVARAVAAGRRGARVLVIRNAVRLVIETQRALEAAAELSFGVTLPGGGRVACPHHARFAPEDRMLLDAALEAALGRGVSRTGGMVIVTSQTAEQSLDIDADVLITDLCPADVLLQRIGRLHRHGDTPRPEGFETASVVVLAPSEAELADCIGKSGEAPNGPLALGRVYEDLLGVVATRRALAARSVLTIPDDNRPLVEAATHDQVLQALAQELGGKWNKHWTQLCGKQTAIAKYAAGGAIDWHGRILPLKESEVVKTRLGLDNRTVLLPPGTVGPFGAPISALPLPARWLRDVPADAEPVVEAAAGEVTMRVADRAFRYDRLGLQLLGGS